MKYDIFTFHAWLGERLGWWSAIPLTIFWAVLWPIGIIWGVVSSIQRYNSRDISRAATTAPVATTKKIQEEPVPFYIVCWALCWLPLISQGLVPIALELAGADVKALFIAFYLPNAYQWPFMITMTTLGAVLLGIAISGTYSKRKTSKPTA